MRTRGAPDSEATRAWTHRDRHGRHADTPRRAALEALLRIEDGAFAHILVPDMLRRRRFDTRDRALVTELVYGSVRMQRTVDYLLMKVSSRPLAELEPHVRAALRLGAYQLLIGIPSHAAVSETVNLVSARVRGFVNGVLRALARLGPAWPLPDRLRPRVDRDPHLASRLDRRAARSTRSEQPTRSRPSSSTTSRRP